MYRTVRCDISYGFEKDIIIECKYHTFCTTEHCYHESIQKRMYVRTILQIFMLLILEVYAHF